MTFEQEIESAINRHAQENASNTPDFILAQYLLACLTAWNTGVQQRETWYGRDARPAPPGVLPATDAPGPEGRCSRCGYSARPPICTKCGLYFNPPPGPEGEKTNA